MTWHTESSFTPDAIDRQMNASETFSWLTGSEMGGRIRAFDWRRTPLGPIENWPAALVSTLGVCLTAQYPMAIYWGSEGWLLYNDAWRPILGDKHPWALGRAAHEVWPELWDTISPLLHSVQTTGQAVWRGDELLPMQRFGYTEECYFDYSFNPIRGQNGAVEGILNIVQETTYRVLNDRRMRLLRELASRSGFAHSQEDACNLAMEALATDQTDVPFALLYHIDRDRRHAHLIASTGLPPENPARQQTVSLTPEEPDSGWPLSAPLQDGVPVIVDDVGDRFGPLPGGSWSEPTGQALLLPLSTVRWDGRAVPLAAGINPRRPLDDDYRSFFTMVESHIAGALTNAEAYSSEKRRAEALTELDRAKTAFFSNVSHEFRTPLTLMLGPLEEELRERPHAPRLEVAHRNSLRLLKLVNTLLEFSRLEAGRVEARYEPTDLAGYSAELASQFRSAVEQAGLVFRIDCPPLPETIYVDRDMWEKIVLNLLSNAFKFTFQGDITLSLHAQTGGVELRVQDTGVGIPPEALPRLFERFYRVQDMRSRTYEGSGIGLALVQELVQLHGGTVRVNSQVDQGSTFVVTLPFGNAHLPPDKVVPHGRPTTPTTGVGPYLEEALHWLPEPQHATKPADGRPDPAEAPLSTTSAETARPRVLVVDDNADMRQYIARLLADRYHVIAMPEGMSALIEARRQPPDLILSDIMMPQLDGFGLLQALRDDPALKTIPVILLSARAGEESRIEGLGRGADDYLVKPFGARELLARVATHLDMARVRREAQKEIAHSEARFEAIVSQATAAVAQTDLNGRFLFVNQRFCELLGYSAAELLGMNMQQVTDPDDLPANLVLFHRLTAGGPDFVIEKRYRRKDGSAVWTRVSVGGVREDGELRHILAVGLDITDRKRQEAELLALTHRQSLLYDLADVVNRAEALTGLYEKAIGTIIEPLHADRPSILLFDDEGVMRFEAWRGLSQAYREAVEGHSPWIPDQQDPPAIFIPDVAASDLHTSLRSVIQSEGVSALGFIPLTYGGRLLGKFMMYFDRPHVMDEQEIGLAQTIARTLAVGIERARAGELLRSNEERLRLAMAAGSMGAWDADLSTGATDWDAKQYELFDRPKDKPLTHAEQFYESIHPDDVPRVREAAAQAELTGSFSQEFRVIAQDGSIRWLSGHGTAVKNDQGQAVRMVGINYDITRRKHVEEALQRSASDLEQRVVERTLELSQSREQLRALATELNLAGQRERQHLATELHDYLAQLLALSRIRLAQAKQQPMTTALGKILSELQDVMDQALTYTRTLVAQLSPPILKEFGLPMALKWLAEQMMQRDLQVSLELGTDHLALPEDQAMLLFQSVRELLMYIVKHASAKQARITVREEEGWLHITVADQGRGFSPPDSIPATRSSGISGFGLFSIRERMLALGGRFELQSHPGQGTEATLTAPLAPRQPRAKPQAGADASVPGALSHKTAHAATVREGLADEREPVDRPIRVLIADDHAMVRQGLCGLLAAYGNIQVVGEAADGEEAVTLTIQLQPDVVLMDVNMPQMDGIEATRRIKQVLPATIVIGLSVQNAAHVGRVMREAGAAAFLNKEAAVEDLYQTIQVARKELLQVP